MYLDVKFSLIKNQYTYTYIYIYVLLTLNCIPPVLLLTSYLKIDLPLSYLPQGNSGLDFIIEEHWKAFPALILVTSSLQPDVCLQTDSLCPLTAALNLSPKHSNKAYYLHDTSAEFKEISLHSSVLTNIIINNSCVALNTY